MNRKIAVTILFLFFAVFSFVPLALAQNNNQNAVLFFSSVKGTYQQGDDVAVSIKVRSHDQAINTVTGSFSLPKNFEVKKIETSPGIADFWIEEPKVKNNIVSFQAVAIKNPYKGDDGLVFTIRGTTTSTATLNFSMNNASVLADDGNATNVLGSTKSLTIFITEKEITKEPVPIATPAETAPLPPSEPAPASLAPVITSEVPPIEPTGSFTIIGKGEPNATTKIDFQDITEPSIGVDVIRSFVKDRTPLKDVEVKNDQYGIFSYVSPKNLVAGTYNAVPEYVNNDTKENIIGTGVKLFIQENPLSKILIIVINTLVLTLPIMALLLLMIFMPIYFRGRLRIMRKKLELEEEKINVQEKDITSGFRKRIR